MLFPMKCHKIETDMSLVKPLQEEFDSKITESLETDISHKKIRKICTYALSGGKRVRPVILLSIYKQLAGKIDPCAYEAALSVEYIHCASLILDDIMDNDISRREKTCIHIKYGQNVAQLVALTLISVACQKIGTSLKSRGKLSDSTLDIYDSLVGSFKSLCVGQFADIKLSHKNVDLGVDLEAIMHNKTSSLFEQTFIWAWVLTHPDLDGSTIMLDIKRIKTLARMFGLMFQIADDFEDVQQDERNGNIVMNYVTNKGPECAKLCYNNNLKKFTSESKHLGIYTDEINQIINYMNKKVELYS
jgi:geranylgeranyl pyrophosphate synthase